MVRSHSGNLKECGATMNTTKGVDHGFNNIDYRKQHMPKQKLSGKNVNTSTLARAKQNDNVVED